MFIADAHCDTLRAVAIENIPLEKCSVTPETLRAGSVGLQTFPLFAGAEGPAGTPCADAIRMLDAVDQLKVPVFTGRLPECPPDAPSGILSCEGGEIFEGSMARFDELHSRGRFRMIALTWNNENEIGFPAKGGTAYGLKPFGLDLLREMDRRGVIADVSHLNEAGFWDVCEHAAVAPMASHSDCRWLCDVPRNLTKAQVRALIDRKGFIGVNFYSRFLTASKTAILDDVVRHIDALCEMGAEDIVGFGSDFDGIDEWPDGLPSPAGFPALMEALEKRGYSRSQLEKIAGLNLWRALKAAEAHGIAAGGIA